MGVPHRVQLRAHRKHWGNTGEERGWLPALLLTLPRSASFVICLSKRRIPLRFRYTSCSLPRTPIQEFSLHQLISPEGYIPLTLENGPAFGWLCLSLRKTVLVKDSQGARFSHLFTDNAQHPKGILETFGRTSSESELSFLLQGSQSFIPWQQCGLSTVLWHKAQAPVSYTCLAARIPHWMKKATRSVNFVPISFSLKCTVQNTFYSNTTRYKIASQYLTEYQRE